MNGARPAPAAPRPEPSTGRVPDASAEQAMDYPLTAGRYIATRLESQIRWYSRSSARNQACYKCLQTGAIVFSSAIPLLVGLWGDVFAGQLAVGVLSSLVAMITGINTLNKFQENWIAYRTTAESLRHHKLLFLTRTAPYSGGDAFHLLVTHVEALISRENSDWERLMISAETGAAPGEGPADAPARAGSLAG